MPRSGDGVAVSDDGAAVAEPGAAVATSDGAQLPRVERTCGSSEQWDCAAEAREGSSLAQ